MERSSQGGTLDGEEMNIHVIRYPGKFIRGVKTFQETICCRPSLHMANQNLSAPAIPSPEHTPKASAPALTLYWTAHNLLTHFLLGCLWHAHVVQRRGT